MLRALDPYHRIRAGVAALFLATVASMALMTVERPVRRGVSTVAPAVSVVAPAGVAPVGVAPAAGPAVAAPAVVPARHPARRRAASAPAPSSH